MWPSVPSGSLASSVSRTACTVVARGCRVSASTWGVCVSIYDQGCLSQEAWERGTQTRCATALPPTDPGDGWKSNPTTH